MEEKIIGLLGKLVTIAVDRKHSHVTIMGILSYQQYRPFTRGGYYQVKLDAERGGVTFEVEAVKEVDGRDISL